MKRSALVAGAAALAAGLGITACGGTSPPGTAASPASAAPTAAPSAAVSGSPSAAGSGAAGSASAGQSIEGIKFYQPSTVVSRAGHSVVLKSPDPVSKVSDFYVSEVDSGGWTSISKNVTSYSANLNVSKPGRGANISVAPSGSGTVISISAYPGG